MRKIFVVFLLAVAAAAAGAQGYPNRPIRLVVPFPPGGSSDLVARTFAPALGSVLGQQVVIDYRGGAGGSIGAAEVAKAAPDGYTLLQVWDTHAANHHLYKVPYDYARSFTPITELVEGVGVIVANPAFPASNTKELIEYARASPGAVMYGSAGAGSSNHLLGARFEQLTGVQMTHVPYKGGGPLITDLLGGHVQICFGSLPLFEPYIRSGKLKALAVLSPARTPQLPDVPAAAEALPGFEGSTWFGLLAPAGLPAAIQSRVHDAVAQVLRDPQVKEAFATRGFDVVASSPEAFSEFLLKQSAAAGALIDSLHIKAD